MDYLFPIIFSIILIILSFNAGVKHDREQVAKKMLEWEYTMGGHCFLTSDYLTGIKREDALKLR